jgi:nucleoside-diphosphate-sugar epimerase
MARIEKIQQELGYTPEIDLEEGLRRTIAWYRSGHH